MQRALGKHFTVLLFLVTFLLPRVVDLHALDYFSGDDEIVPCELCDLSANTQQFNLFTGDVLYEDKAVINKSFVQFVCEFYNSPLSKIVTPTSVYNKPPPSSLLG